MRRSSYFRLLLIVSLVANLCFLVVNINLRGDLKDSHEQSASLKVNGDFINSFFTYTSTKEKYTNIKPFMTDVGYKSSFPSGMEIPEDGEFSVSSVLKDMKQYKVIGTGEIRSFINELQIETTFNNVSSTQTLMVKTTLIWVKGSWKVNEVIFIGDIGTKENTL